MIRYFMINGNVGECLILFSLCIKWPECEIYHVYPSKSKILNASNFTSAMCVPSDLVLIYALKYFTFTSKGYNRGLKENTNTEHFIPSFFPKAQGLGSPLCCCQHTMLCLLAGELDYCRL